MKKIVSILLCVCMMVGIMSAAFAADTDEMKKVLETVKSRIGSTDGYDKFESSTETDDEGAAAYMFEWSSSENKTNLSVAAYSDGTIVDYMLYGRNGSAETVPISERASKAQLKAAAEGFVKQLNPDIAENLKVDDISVNTDTANAHITEYKNGYPIKNSYGDITIDLTGKKLIRFSIDYSQNRKFETGEVIPKEEAIKNFKEKLGAELYYSVEGKWDNDGEYEQTIAPKYRVKDTDKYISAVSGEVVEPKEVYMLYKTADAKGGMMNEAAADTGFTKAELSEIDDIENLISPEKAFEIVKNIKCADIPDVKFKDVSKRLNKNYRDKTREYSFYYHKYDDKTATDFSASVNAENGEVLSFSSYTYAVRDSSDEKEPEISDDKAKQIAESAIKELAPEKASEYKFDSVDTGRSVFVRFVNEIPVEGDRIYVSVDPKTEKVSSYNISYTDGEFPAVTDAISKSEADDIFIKEAGYDIEYIYDGKDKEYKLCYALTDMNGKIDPSTGEYDSYETPTIEGYTDVSGHYSEEAVNALAESEIGFEGTELKPDEPIKQKEFAALVQRVIQDNYKAVIGDDYDYDSLYDCIDFIAPEEADPDGAVTRRDAAKFTVRAMGYIDVAKLDIFKPIFNDMAEDVGYASILAGLKILNGDGNGNFNPEGVLTRAQALIIIYNYLNR